MSHLRSLLDRELLSEFRFRRNPLTTTPMEEELAERFGDLLDMAACDRDEIEELKEQIEGFEKQIAAIWMVIDGEEQSFEQQLEAIRKIINDGEQDDA
jgi:predicted  nucleic acid-binding Zn-ribbon protein